jgi:hypothetical protein
VITGFNTDIEHGGVTYHVQTEDKGLENPLILSLVYVGGAILASKRTAYDDLIEKGFDEKVLAERLQRQHKLLCAAVRAGRVDDLKRMGGERDAATASPPAPPALSEVAPANGQAPASPPLAAPVSESPAEAPKKPAAIPILDLITDASTPIIPEGIKLPPPPPAFNAYQAAATVDEAAPEQAATDADVIPVEVYDEDADELYLKLLDDEGEFRAGQLATIKIYVGRGKFGRQSVTDATVTVKVLGTTFRPLILNTRTDEEGVAVVRALLPQFNSGRAALLIRAADAHGTEAELRRIIHQG